MIDQRIELCCHTKMSRLRGINDINEYVKVAKKRGYTAIGITDTDSTQSFLMLENFLGSSLYKDFKIIYGSEMHFKISEDDDKVYTIYIYVKEQKGLKNLYKLVSIGYRNKINEIPILYKSDLINYRDGLLYASIGEQSEVYQCYNSLNIIDILCFYDFIGIEPHESSRDINKKINDLCKENNKLLIGTSECNFIDKNDYVCNEILNCFKGVFNFRDGDNKYFHTTDELIKLFYYIDNAKEIVVDNTVKVSELIQKVDLVPPRLHCAELEDADVWISKKCCDKAKEIYGDVLPDVVEKRLQLELSVIKNNNCDSIYLILSELAEYSNKLGYEVYSRGCVGNSLVAYLLGITGVNPLDNDLPFELLVGKDYSRKPDIDLIFSERIIDSIFEYLQNWFGKDRVVWCGTVGGLLDGKIQCGIKIYSKKCGVEDIGDSKVIENKLNGIKISSGEHCRGVFILPEGVEITDICATEIGVNGHVKTHNDYHYVVNAGLYKFDLLSSDGATMLHELEKRSGLASREIDLNDRETLKVFLNANNESYPISIKGVPEFETSFFKKMVEVAKPREFNDLVCLNALSHGSGTWNDNASVLIEKYGVKVSEVISSREDMYNYLVENGVDVDMAHDIVAFVRDGKAFEKEKYGDVWEMYKGVLRKCGIPEWYVESAERIRYLYPKANAIDNVVMDFKIAWYKVHCEEVFQTINLDKNVV